MNEIFKKIPKIDLFVSNSEFEGFNKELLTKVARAEIENLRKKIAQEVISDVDMNKLIKSVKTSYHKTIAPSLKPLINATGIIIHTNMGRSPISYEAVDSIKDTICGYSNLEYNEKEGKRGERYTHIVKDLQTLLGVEDAIVVNNNASAVFLILNTFAKNKEVVVSRGELVEIGGSFRVPKVMKESGAILKEVGTTNKTKLKDYENAITENSSILMKVHKSNFDIVGFSEDVNFEEISNLAKKYKLLDYYDLGSAYIPTLPYNLSAKEPNLQNILSRNSSLVSFSGDKLFGSVQAGIILGKKEYIEQLKKNQLLRMLRVDKITLAILQENIRAYIYKEYNKIPTLNMLFTDTKELEERAISIKNHLSQDICTIKKSFTYMGGGTLPNRKFPTVALAFRGDAKELEKKFRKEGLIGRIEDEQFLIDFRSIEKKYDEKIIQITNRVLAK